MSNPFSWSLDAWYVVLQAASAMILGLTVAIGYFANKRQAGKIVLLEAANIEAQRNLEAERKTRLEMEQDIAPRRLPLISSGGATNIDPLRQYAGTKLIIEYAPDDEAQVAAEDIENATKAAGWQLVKADCPPDLIGLNEGVDGVVVTPHRPDNPDPKPEELRSKKASGALVSVLESSNWKARLAPGHTGELSADEVKVQVGFKPMPHFLKPMIDAVKKRYETGRR
jgi:hypothetical protein